MTEDEKINYPIGGYAPGSYSCACYECKEDFIGDKRAVQCKPCAINRLQESVKRLAVHKMNLSDEVEKLRQKLIDAGLEQPAIRKEYKGA